MCGYQMIIPYVNKQKATIKFKMVILVNKPIRLNSIQNKIYLRINLLNLLLSMCVFCWCIIEIGGETTTKPHQPISIDDELNQHFVNDDQCSADGANCSNNGDNNIVMQETVAVG